MFKAIQSLALTVDMVKVIGIGILSRFIHICSPNMIAMKESILNINQVNGPTTRNGDTKNNMNSNWFDNRIRRVIKFKTKLLVESLIKKANLIVLKVAFDIKFV